MASMLERLSDELILEIFKHLRPARLLVYLSHDHEVYSAGISSNASVAIFASLCLTSTHLSRLAIPELYGNLVKRQASQKLPYRSSPGQESRSEHYLRQFFEFGEAVVRSPSLGQHLRYVNFSFESSDMLELCRTYLRRERWSSHRKAMKRLASQIWGATQLQVWIQLCEMRPEQAQSVLLAAMAPNITHVVIDVYENTLSTNLSLLGIDNPLCEKPPSRVHDFSRLERLILTMRGDWFDKQRKPDYESPFLPATPVRHLLPQLTNLRHFQQILAPSPGIYDSVLHPHIVMAKLETLNLHMCNVSLKLIAATLESCPNLKNFLLSPSEAEEFFDFRILYSALRKSLGTLENVSISVGESYLGDVHQDPLGTFSDFLLLKRLRVPDIVMMGKPEGYDLEGPDYDWSDFCPQSSLIDLLPPYLECLFLASEFVGLSDRTEFLWEFVRNLDQLSRLRSFGSVGSRNGSFDRLSEELASRGVQFTESDFAFSGEWLGTVF
ncbi:hypothetical protein HBI52_229310 [Parastagonospora nodorum]|nr:hypothetical protein HBI06_240880 [Parastagonospora nodorum]KAH4225293.1 hypothetical protein HBI05_229440 [Parastagonospora nodorum]KAH5489378.1 hypothetical protein HBI52_229310 [Parastagonospora nodorum]